MMFKGLNVTEVDQSGASEHTVHHVALHAPSDAIDAKLSTLLNKYTDIPSAGAHAHLSVEPKTYHSIPLSDNAQPPARNSYCLSQAETGELNRQVASLLGTVYIQPSNSPYGHPVLTVKKTTGVLREPLVDCTSVLEHRSVNTRPVKTHVCCLALMTWCCLLQQQTCSQHIIRSGSSLRMYQKQHSLLLTGCMNSGFYVSA